MYSCSALTAKILSANSSISFLRGSSSSTIQSRSARYSHFHIIHSNCILLLSLTSFFKLMLALKFTDLAETVEILLEKQYVYLPALLAVTLFDACVVLVVVTSTLSSGSEICNHVDTMSYMPFAVVSSIAYPEINVQVSALSNLGFAHVNIKLCNSHAH